MELIVREEAQKLASFLARTYHRKLISRGVVLQLQREHPEYFKSTDGLETNLSRLFTEHPDKKALASDVLDPVLRLSRETYQTEVNFKVIDSSSLPKATTDRIISQAQCVIESSAHSVVRAMQVSSGARTVVSKLRARYPGYFVDDLKIDVALTCIFRDYPHEIQPVKSAIMIALAVEKKTKTEAVVVEYAEPQVRKVKARRDLPSIAAAGIAEISPASLPQAFAASTSSTGFTCYCCNQQIRDNRVSTRCFSCCRLNYHQECWLGNGSCQECHSPLRKYSTYINGCYHSTTLVQKIVEKPTVEEEQPAVVVEAATSTTARKEVKPYQGSSYRAEDVSNYERLRAEQKPKAQTRKREKERQKLAKYVDLSGDCTCPSSKLNPTASEFVPRK